MLVIEVYVTATEQNIRDAWYDCFLQHSVILTTIKTFLNISFQYFLKRDHDDGLCRKGG